MVVHERFETVMAMKIHVVFWVMTPCSDVVGYQCVESGSMVLRNVGYLTISQHGVITQRIMTENIVVRMFNFISVDTQIRIK
jgi:hypothetical protein